VVGCGLDSSGSGEGSVVNGSEPSGPTQGVEFLD
jgi:hypothetical protein